MTTCSLCDVTFGCNLEIIGAELGFFRSSNTNRAARQHTNSEKVSTMSVADEPDEPCVEAVFTSDRELLIRLACRIVDSRAVAEEIVQESWLRWYSKDYRAADARPIFRRIVANLAKDWRKKRTVEIQALSEVRLLRSHVPSTEDLVLARNEVVLIVRTLERMSATHIKAFRMRALDQRTYKEISARLGISVSQAHRLIEQVFVELVLAVEP